MGEFLMSGPLLYSGVRVEVDDAIGVYPGYLLEL